MEKFCILPWIHAHVLPDGDVLPCCAVAVGSFSLGNVNKSSLKEIWNDSAYRELRRAMLANESVPTCRVCYEAERSGGTSLRTKSNQDFSHHLKLRHETLPDGSLTNFHLRYYDVRFSNLCNLSCRMCCPELSSSVGVDMARRNQELLPKVISVYDDRELFLSEFREHIPYLEEIYFAGGEPLLIDAHWWALEELIAQNRTSIRIRYNTNFSRLSKGKWNVSQFWPNFPNLEIGASLDAAGVRGEYIREGTNWPNVLTNREQVRRLVPQADFRVAVTVGLMNVYHVPEMIRDFIRDGFTTPHGFFTNNLMYPEYMSTQVLPPRMKKEVTEMYLDLISELRRIGSPEWILMNLNSVVNFMNSEDKSSLLREFIRQTDQLDAQYGKSFFDTFPELRSLAEEVRSV